MQKNLYLLLLLAIIGLSSCRTSCGCPMAEVDQELSVDFSTKKADA